MKLSPRTFRIGLAFIGLLYGTPALMAQTVPTWPAVSAQDLGLKESPINAGEPAMILYYELQTDNAKSTESKFVRIKIFREEGKKYADIQIPYIEKQMQVDQIQARTISPNGQATEFDGQIFDKEVVKTRRFRYNTKTLTLPDIQVGSILEYSYRVHWHEGIPALFKNPSGYLIDGVYAWPAADWPIQQELSIRHGHFTLHRVGKVRLQTRVVGLGKDVDTQTMPDGTVQLDVDNVPAFEKEEHAPPEENLKAQANVFYVLGGWGEVSQQYWHDLAWRQGEAYARMFNKSKKIEQEAASLLAPGDSDEAKLRKLYVRAQQIRDLSYEAAKTKRERKQENLKDNKNAEDVLKHGYAFNNEINFLFIALARAAGFRAYPVRVASRNHLFFQPDLLDPTQLDATIVEVRLGQEVRYFDPATHYCPFDLLPWEESDTRGIRLDRFAGEIVHIPLSAGSRAMTRREADLKLDADGNLKGSATVAYSGQEALTRRLQTLEKDDVEFRKDAEEDVRAYMPHGASVKLLSIEGQEEAENPLTLHFQIDVPNFAVTAGRRLILPLAVFHATEGAMFSSNRRVHALCFSYPADVQDNVKLEMPAGFQTESLPSENKIDSGIAHYELSAKKEGNTLELKRLFKIGDYFFPVQQYAPVKTFFERVRSADETQITLKPVSTAQAN
jgi:hypothetical protein